MSVVIVSPTVAVLIPWMSPSTDTTSKENRGDEKLLSGRFPAHKSIDLGSESSLASAEENPGEGKTYRLQSKLMVWSVKSIYKLWKNLPWLVVPGSGRGAAGCRPPPTRQAPALADFRLCFNNWYWKSSLQAVAGGKHFFILTKHCPPRDVFCEAWEPRKLKFSFHYSLV